MAQYLTIDVGGTNIKYALMTQEGTIQLTGVQPTPADQLEAFLDALFAIIDQFKNDIAGVAFSVPGKVDTQTGTIYFGGALTFLDGLCLKEVIGEKYQLPVAVQNDAKAAALAELWLGSLKGVQDGAVIVLGTGVGGGIILDGKLRLGPHFQSGELSLSVLDASQPGPNKMVGVIGSAVQMISQVNQALGHADLKDGLAAFEAIVQRDEVAYPIFQAYCRQIAYLILNLQAFFDLTTYAIGGGISSQPIVVEEITAQFDAILDEAVFLRMNIPDIHIVATQYKNDANLYGALYTLLED